MVSYIADFIYGASKYPCALFCPRVFWGHFNKHESQRQFFELLLSKGFRRTFWQLVFPGQIAGIVKRVPVTEIGANEYHVRFYADGTIECELEVGRWNFAHWTGPRNYGEKGIEFLNDLLEEHTYLLSFEAKNNLRQFFGTKNFTPECVRKRSD